MIVTGPPHPWYTWVEWVEWVEPEEERVPSVKIFPWQLDILRRLWHGDGDGGGAPEGGKKMREIRKVTTDDAIDTLIDALRYYAYQAQGIPEGRTWGAKRDAIYQALQILDPEGAGAELTIAIRAAETRLVAE